VASNRAFGDMAQALRDHDLDELKSVVDGDRAATQPHAWIQAMREASDEHGVKLPGWLAQYVELLTRPQTAD
jgi:hypothetical protein